jgi:DNA polymerase-3 subunit delta'
VHATGEIVLRHQPRVLRAIAQAARGEGAHALLLAGRSGQGSWAAAAWLAQARLCPAGGGDGCAVCSRVARRTHPDLHWLVPEGVEYRIEAIRDLVHTLGRTPFEAAAHVVVLEDADTLNASNHEAGNALLTMLEEPPGPTLFVLMCERPSLLLPTLRSRSAMVAVPPLTRDALLEVVAATGVSTSDLAARGLTPELISRMARGDAWRAWGLAVGNDALARYQAAMHVAGNLASGRMLPGQAVDLLIAQIDAAGAAAEAIAEREFAAMMERMTQADARSFQSKSNTDGVEQRTRRRARKARTRALRELMTDLAAFYRDLMVVAAGSDGIVTCADQLPTLQSLRTAPAAQRAVAALDAIDEVPLRAEVNNADVSLLLASLCSELSSLAAGRIRARRTLGAGAVTPQGVDLALG